MKKVLKFILKAIFVIFLLLWFWFFSFILGDAYKGTANYFKGFLSVFIILIPYWLIKRKQKIKKQVQAKNDFANSREGQRCRVHMTNEELESIDKGILPTLYGSGVVLRDGEKAYFNSAAELITSKERVVGHTGRSGGVSVRVAKGVTLHSGASTGQAVYGRVEQSFNGSLIITSERIIFLNPINGFECPVKKITAIRPYSDGFGIQSGNKNYILIVPLSDYAIRVLRLMRLY